MSDDSSTGGGRLTSSDGSTSYDVLVVGGGPAGCSVGVFTARYGLETCILDRGNSSIKRCAYLENYLGFPAGVDVDTFCALAHDHAREAGCEIVRDLVEAVHRDDAALLDAVDDDRIVEYARRLEAGGSRAETVRSAER